MGKRFFFYAVQEGCLKKKKKRAESRLSHRNDTSSGQDSFRGAVRAVACSHDSRSTVPGSRRSSTGRVGTATRLICLNQSHVGPLHELTKLLSPLESGLRTDLGEIVEAGISVAVAVGHDVLVDGVSRTNANLPQR